MATLFFLRDALPGILAADLSAPLRQGMDILYGRVALRFERECKVEHIRVETHDMGHGIEIGIEVWKYAEPGLAQPQFRLVQRHRVGYVIRPLDGVVRELVCVERVTDPAFPQVPLLWFDVSAIPDDPVVVRNAAEWVVQQGKRHLASGAGDIVEKELNRSDTTAADGPEPLVKGRVDRGGYADEWLTSGLPGGFLMCRSIKTLHNFQPPATPGEVRAASQQFVRKLSGFTSPSKANEAAFTRAVDHVALAVQELLNSLVTKAPLRDRDAEASKARVKAAARFSSSVRPRDVSSD
ncbi:MAG: DUF2277 domain-containing protein [Candidatus Rokuibacteriota bacterium]